MSDNHARYHLIRQGLEQLLPTKLSASQLRHFHTLALLVHGLIASAHCQLPKLAAKAPKKAKVESRIKQFQRFLDNDKVTQQTFWLPFAQPLLQALSNNGQRELKICLDGSAMGRECVALVASVVYAGRALPIAWLVVKGKKGHLPQERHLELIAMVHKLVDGASRVVVLGDGEFDGTLLLERITSHGWHYVVRTAKSSQLKDGDLGLNFEQLGVGPGGLVAVPGAKFTAQEYGPVLAVAVWDARYEQPLYLITNLSDADTAVEYYTLRFRIECFFSDTKTRGFRLDKSHLAEPERLSRLLIAAVLAYWWLTYLGVTGREKDWDKLVHRTDRTDLSFFQLGWRILEEFLMCGRIKELPFALFLSPNAHF
jgi:hypothetical protein